MISGAHDAIFSDENPFWQYSLAQYAKPGCANFLLAAQDQKSLNINRLLFLGFAAQLGQTVSGQLHPQISQWHHSKVINIRGLRRRIKVFNNQKFYEEAKSLELYAEKIEQYLFFALQPRKKSEVCFQKCVRKSIDEWFKEEGIIEEEAWLQVLIQYLQPKAD